MLRKLLFLSLFGLMAGPTLALSSGQAYGEILIFGAQGQDPTGPHPADAGPARPELASGVAGESIPLQIQCWQYGVKIIDEAGLDGVRLRDLIEGGGIGLQGDTWEYGDVNILPVNDTSTCLIKPMP